MSLAAVKKHIFRGGGGVAEAVADVPAERHAVHLSRGAAPVPGVVVCPHATTPVQHGKAFRRVKNIGFAAVGKAAVGSQAVNLLVKIEVPGLAEGGADDHALLRLVKKLHSAVQSAQRAEFIHVHGEHSAPQAIVFEIKRPALSAVVSVADGGRFRQTYPAQGHKAHGAGGYLPALVEIQHGDRIKAHVAVIVHSESQSEATIIDEVVIPFLYPQRACLYGGPAVNGQKLFCIARLGQIAL